MRIKIKVFFWVKYLILGLLFFFIVTIFIVPKFVPSCNLSASHLQVAAATRELKLIKFALKTYYEEKGQYPDTLEALAKENILKKEYLVDPWHKAYYYEVLPSKDVKNNQNYTLLSLGSDGIKGTKDDLLP